MADVIAFPGARSAPPQAPEGPPTGPALVVPIPTTHVDRPWLRRQGLRIAAMVGGASFAEVERILVHRHARRGTDPHAAAVDILQALEFVRAVRDAADAIGRHPLPEHGPRHGGAA